MVVLALMFGIYESISLVTPKNFVTAEVVCGDCCTIKMMSVVDHVKVMLQYSQLDISTICEISWEKELALLVYKISRGCYIFKMIL